MLATPPKACAMFGRKAANGSLVTTLRVVGSTASVDATTEPCAESAPPELFGSSDGTLWNCANTTLPPGVPAAAGGLVDAAGVAAAGAAAGAAGVAAAGAAAGALVVAAAAGLVASTAAGLLVS